MSLAATQQAMERRAQAFALRETGMTYRDIGRAFGVSLERARQMVIRAERDRSSVHWNGDPLDIDRLRVRGEITMRTWNCLRSEGIRTLRELDRPDRFSYLMRLPNFGRKSLRELTELLDAKAERAEVDRQ